MPLLIIADDSLFQRFSLSKIAQAEGWEVYQAETGRQCLELIREKAPHGVVLDLNMPDLNGFNVLEQAEEFEKTPDFVVITADIQNSTRERCRELGVKDILHKPVDEAQLREVLKSMSP